MYVVLLTGLSWCSNSLDELLYCLWVGSGGLAARRVKAGSVPKPVLHR